MFIVLGGGVRVVAGVGADQVELTEWGTGEELFLLKSLRGLFYYILRDFFSFVVYFIIFFEIFSLTNWLLFRPVYLSDRRNLSR